MKLLLSILLFLPLKSIAKEQLNFSCELQGLVYKTKTFVTFLNPIKHEITLKQSYGGYQSENETVFSNADLKVQIALGFYSGHTDLTAYVFDQSGKLLADVAGISESKNKNGVELVGAHFFNGDASISSLIVECKLH